MYQRETADRLIPMAVKVTPVVVILTPPLVQFDPSEALLTVLRDKLDALEKKPFFCIMGL